MQKFKPNWKRISIGLAVILIISIASLGYVLSTPSTINFTISSGLYPYSADYTLYNESATYSAKNNAGAIEATSTNLTALIISSELALPAGGVIYLVEMQLPSEITSLSDGITLFTEYFGTITVYKQRTYMFYEGTYVNSPPSYYEQIALAITDHPLSALISTSDTLIWKKYGVILPPIGISNTDFNCTVEATVIYENGIFKMFHRSRSRATPDKNYIYYSESTDAKTWSHYPNPIVGSSSDRSGYASPMIIKQGSDYWLYVENTTGTVTGKSTIELWTGSSVLTLTLDTSPILSPGSGGSWDDEGLANPFVWNESSNWYMTYDGYDGSEWQTGLATSSDGKNWVKYGGNPIIPHRGGGGSWVYKYGTTYYMWLHSSYPTGISLPHSIYRQQSTDLHTWTNETLVLQRTMAFENSQASDPSLVEILYSQTLPSSGW